VASLYSLYPSQEDFSTSFQYSKSTMMRQKIQMLNHYTIDFYKYWIEERQLIRDTEKLKHTCHCNAAVPKLPAKQTWQTFIYQKRNREIAHSNFSPDAYLSRHPIILSDDLAQTNKPLIMVKQFVLFVFISISTWLPVFKDIGSLPFLSFPLRPPSLGKKTTATKVLWR